ncbi:hypothetical protein CRYUN_Cryun41cG0067700 [Craigia yunnanensis]
MFLSKSDEEITANRKLAKYLTENWSRTIFNKSARFSNLGNIEENAVPFMKPSGIQAESSIVVHASMLQGLKQHYLFIWYVLNQISVRISLDKKCEESAVEGYRIT